MAPLKQSQQRKHEEVSTERAVTAALITALSLVLLVLWGYHALWTIRVFTSNRFGGVFNNLVFGVGSLVADAGLSIKLVTVLNNKYLDDGIDSDHKKYI